MENINFDGEIKLNNWSKKIKINEKGDYLILNIGDLNLIMDMSKLLKNTTKKLETTQLAIEKEQNSQKKLELGYEFSKTICHDLNTFFKDDTLSNKIFSTDTPYVDDILDFIMQICEMIEKFTGQKIDNLNALSNKFKTIKNNRLGSRI